MSVVGRAKLCDSEVKVLYHQTLYREKRFHAAFPSVIRFSDDNLLLAFRRARDGLWLVPEEKRRGIDPFQRMDHMDSRSHIMLMELNAHGENQVGDLDVLPMDPEAGDQDPSLLLLPNDDVFLAAFSWYPLPVDAASLIPARGAPGETTPGTRFIYWGSHTALRHRASGQWLSHHRYLQPQNGFGHSFSPDGDKALVGPVRGRPLWRESEILLPLYGSAKEGCALFASKDRGKSWDYRGMLVRDETAKVTFQEPALCEDGQGGLICFMRTAGADGVEEIIVREDGLCPDLGYPWAVELSDGRVLVSYYWTDGEGIRHIVGSWLELVRS
jgi:sialidase-1